MNYIEKEVKNYYRVQIFPEEFNEIVKDKEEKEIKRLYPNVVVVNKLPFRWALAINIFGKVYAKRKLSNIELQHELIHSLQMKDLGYLKFYLFYLYEWIKLAIKYKNIYQGYKQISFEKEAYIHQNDIHYIINKHDHILRKSWKI